VTTVTAIIEALVGLACLAFAWPSWQRGGGSFRLLAICLALAGTVAVVNAVVTLA
jgi:hypothetical protein